MSLILEPPLPAIDIESRLGRLRRRMRSITLIAGGAGLSSACLAFVAVITFSDFVLSWPAPFRALFVVVGVVGFTLLTKRWIISPWQASGNIVQLARQVESATSGVNEALASSVELAALGNDPLAGSKQLQRATTLYAVRRTRNFDFTAAADSRPLLISFLSLLGSALLALQTLFIIPSPTLAFARLFDPFGNHPWPTKTQIAVDAPLSIARGEPFSFLARLTGVIPDRLHLLVELENAPVAEQTLVLTPQRDGTENVAIKLEPARVNRSFRYRLAANDTDTGWRRVTVSVPPQLAKLDGRPTPLLSLDFPQYTDLKSRNLPDGAGAVEAVFGTNVRLQATTDRAIGRAAIELGLDTRLLAGLSGLLLADAQSTTLLSTIPATFALTSPNPLAVSNEGTNIVGSFLPLLSGSHVLTFKDHNDLIGRWPINVHIMSDPAPLVRVDEPSNSANLELAPNSVLRLRAIVEDVQFAIRSVRLEYRTSSNESTRAVTLYDGPVFGSILPSFVTPYSVPAAKLRPTRLIVERLIPLSTFRHSDGKALTDGDQLLMSIIANDFDDVSPTKAPGRSAEIELRIVAPDRLLAGQQLARQSLAKSLRELLAHQSEAVSWSQDAERQRRATGDLRAEDRERIGQSESLQLRIQSRLGDDRDGVRAEAERMRRQVADNPNASPSDQARAERLANELDRLAREVLEPIGPLLSAARHESGPIPANERSSGPLSDALRRQRESERSLRSMLADVEAGRETAALAAEASSIALEQDRLNRLRETLSRSTPPGAAPNQLSNDQQNALTQAKEAQLQLAQRASDFARQLDVQAKTMLETAAQELAHANELEQKAEHLIHDVAVEHRRKAAIAREKAERLTADAASVDKARNAIQGNDQDADATALHEKMNQAAEAIGRNQLGAAYDRQSAASKQLDHVRDTLREPNQPDGDRLMKDRQQAEKQLDQLIRDQESLQDRTLAAEGLTDRARRHEQLEQLAREQDRLADQARELANDRRSQGQTSAAREIDQAARKMDQARDQLEHGNSASSKQDDVLERLDDAADQMKRDASDLSEQLRRDAQIKLHERFKGLAERQYGLDAEADRVFQAAKQAGSWSRSLQKSLIDLAHAEKALAQEIDLAANEQLKRYKILHRLALEASKALNDLEQKIEIVRENGLTMESLENDRLNIRRPQQIASHRLNQLLGVLQPSSDQSNGSRNTGSRPSRAASDNKPATEGDTIPPEVQLKILRQLQAELKDRIDEFHKQHPDVAKWTDSERTGLESLRKVQMELVQLFGELTTEDQAKPREKK